MGETKERFVSRRSGAPSLQARYRRSAKRGFAEWLVSNILINKISKRSLAQKVGIAPSGLSRHLTTKSPYKADVVNLAQVGEFADAMGVKLVIIKEVGGEFEFIMTNE